MMLSRLGFLFLLFLLPFPGFAQHLVEGTVKDSLESPLAHANIIAVPLDSMETLKFSITEENGRYRLDLKEIPYTVTVSYPGYESVEFEIHPTGDIVRDIVLSPKAEGLEEVVIDLPVIVKQDTLYTMLTALEQERNENSKIYSPNSLE